MIDINTVVTILGVFIANAAIILPLFLWNRSEARNDIRHMDMKLETNAKEIKNEIGLFHQQMLEEHKDFHGRLCTIEERYLKFKMGEK